MAIRRIIAWTVLWLSLAAVLVSGLDNLFFQPPLPGLPNAVFALGAVGYVLVELGKARRRRNRP